VLRVAVVVCAKGGGGGVLAAKQGGRGGGERVPTAVRGKSYEVTAVHSFYGPGGFGA
jgi:hypothetical protein